MSQRSCQPVFLVAVLAALTVASCSAQHCTNKDGNLVPRGHVQLHPDDGCLSEVCRCASEDRCDIVTERRMVLIRVNETKLNPTPLGQSSISATSTQMMQCTCVDHLPDSTEMQFLCKSPTQPGREIGAKITGCVNSEGGLQLPGQKVRIQTILRNEDMQCDCNSDGHYVNCLPADDLGDRCLDTVSNRTVPLAGTYYRVERNSRGLPIRLRCICVRSDQETTCTVV